MATLPQRQNSSIEEDPKIRRFGARRPASASAPGEGFPGGPVIGDTFFETDNKILYVWDGTTWREISGPRLATRVALGSNGASTGVHVKANMSSITYQDVSGLINQTTDQYTCPLSGLYEVSASVRFDIQTDADQYLLLSIFKNNVEATRSWFLIRATVSSDDLNLTIHDIMSCAANDVLDIRYYADVAAEAVSSDGWATFRRV